VSILTRLFKPRPDPAFQLAQLNVALEQRAADEYRDGAGTIKKCARCRVAPVHSYDSFGMPFHKLECPKCGSHADYPKEFSGVVKRWNGMQRK